MKLLIFILLFLSSCNRSHKVGIQTQKEKASNKPEVVIPEKKPETNIVGQEINAGYIFINLYAIYSSGDRLVIPERNASDSLAFNGKKISFGNKSYDIIEDSGYYKENIKCVSYDPEYNLFIVKTNGMDKDGNYIVEINDKDYLINREEYSSILEIKTPEKYILESYPKLKRDGSTPLRKEPSEDSEIIANYLDYLYVPIKIQGDWLYVKDDKDCYIEEPSETDIYGWIRWRENGEIIIDVAHSC